MTNEQIIGRVSNDLELFNSGNLSKSDLLSNLRSIKNLMILKKELLVSSGWDKEEDNSKGAFGGGSW